MATTYTTLLKIAKPTQGELDGSWGTVVNDNITSMIEEAIAGRSVINTWSGNSATLSTANGTTAESRSAMLSLTDTGTNLSGAATVICPTLSKIYIVKNGTGQAATLKTSGGTGISVPNGTTMFLFCDGTNVVEAISNVTGAFTASAAITASGVITGLTVEATGDTAAGDNAAMGYTSAEGLILTGQGSTNDVTIKNDADADVITIATGATNVDIVGDVTASTINADGDTAASDNAAMGYTSAEGLILTGQGSTNDITIKNDADADVITIATGGTNVDIVGDVTASTVNADGDTAAGDDAAMGYTSAEGLILTGQGSTNDVTIKNDADADVITIATGATNVDIVGDVTASTLNADGDTSASDNAAIGYTSAEGLILTGQGSTNDVTLKNDADGEVFGVPTGTTGVTFKGVIRTDDATDSTSGTSGSIQTDGGIGAVKEIVTDATFQPLGDTAASDKAAVGYTSAEGLILTGQGSTNDITLKNDADGEVCGVPTGTDDLRFPDNAKAEWGTGGDLQIYHDASNSYINDTGTGNLKIAASQIDLLGGTDGAETMATFVDNGAVTLYYDDTAALATASGGGTLTGTWTASTQKVTSRLFIGDIATSVPVSNGQQNWTQSHEASNRGGMTWFSTHNSAGGAETVFAKGRGGSIGSYGVVSDDDTLGAITWCADDGTDMNSVSARILANVDGTPGSNDTPGRLTFWTTADGAAASTEQMRIDNAGKVTVSKILLANTSTAGSQTGSVTLDFSLNQNFVLTFTGNVTLANPTTESVGQAGVIVCIQDGTGSRTLSLGSQYKTAGDAGITLSTAANAVDIIPYFVSAADSILIGAVQLALSGA